MGMISITRATQRLSSPGSTPVNHVSIPNYHIDKNRGASKIAQSHQYIAKGISDLGRALFEVGVEQDRERRDAEDNETEAAFEQKMRNAFVGEEGQPGVFGSVDSAMDTTSLEKANKSGQDLVSDKAIRDFLDEREYSRRNREKIILRLQRVSRPYANTLQVNTLKKAKDISIAAADNAFYEKQRTWQANMADEEVASDVIDTFAASQEKRGMPAAKVAEGVDKICRGMAYDIAAHNINVADGQTLDQLEETIKTKPDLLYGTIQAGDIGNDKIAKYFALKGESAFGEKEIEALKTAVSQRRNAIDNEQKRGVSVISSQGFESANTIWDRIDQTKPNPNRLSGTEKAIDSLKAILDRKREDGKPELPDGSTARSVAMRDLANLEKAADGIAGEELMRTLIDSARENPQNPKRIWNADERDVSGKVVKKGGLASDIPAGSRKARLAEQIQASFDAQTAPAKTQMRKNRIAELKLKQLDGVTNRAVYKAEILDAAVKREIDVADWMKLNEGFEENWTKGSDGRISQKSLFARSALKSIQDEFGGDLSGAFAFNPKTGKAEYDKKSGYDGLSYGQSGFVGSLGFSVVTDLLPSPGRLSAQDVEELVDAAAELGRYDGETLGYDPVTRSREKNLFGEKIDPKEKFDAAEYFRKFVRKMKTDKFVDGQVDYISMMTEAVIRLQGRDAEQSARDQRTILDSVSNTSGREAVIKQPSTKSVGVAQKK